MDLSSARNRLRTLAQGLIDLTPWLWPLTLMVAGAAGGAVGSMTDHSSVGAAAGMGATVLIEVIVAAAARTPSDRGPQDQLIE